MSSHKKLARIMRKYEQRIIWLILGLFGALMIAKVINEFEKLLSENLVLVGFIPLVVYISDAVGTQMESVIIRTMATKRKFVFKRFFWDQFKTTFLISVTLSMLAYVAVLLFFGGTDIALTVSIGLFTAIMAAVITGSVIPYLFWKFHQDPAEASGPIATVIQDFLSVLMFFLTASLILT